MPWSLTVGRIAGTAVRIHITFILFLVWIGASALRQDGGDAALHWFATVLKVAAEQHERRPRCRHFNADHLQGQAGAAGPKLFPQLPSLCGTDPGNLGIASGRFLPLSLQLLFAFEQFFFQLQVLTGGNWDHRWHWFIVKPPFTTGAFLLEAVEESVYFIKLFLRNRVVFVAVAFSAVER